MAKKKKEAEAREEPGREKDTLYPWLRLLELEVRRGESGAGGRSRGRPPNPFPRKPVHITLTEDELKTLDHLADLLSERMGRVHRGHLIAFLVFYLYSQLEPGPEGQAQLPEPVRSLSDLALYLESNRASQPLSPPWFDALSQEFKNAPG